MDLPDGVELTEGEGGLAVLRVTTADCRGALTLQGAHVTSWHPVGQEQDVLFVARRSQFAPGKAIRGGIPLCGPWFANGVNGDRTPAHGFFRTSDWTLEGVADSPTGPVCHLRLDGSDHGVDLTARLEATFGADLRLALTVTAGARPLADVEALFHSYLRVGDVGSVTVDGLDGAHYLDKTRDKAPGTQAGPITFEAETDRIHTATGPVTVHDPELGRRIVTTPGGTSRVVVWSPWTEKAATLSDLGDEWPSFVCIEPGNVDTGAVDLAPGRSVTVSLLLSVTGG